MSLLGKTKELTFEVRHVGSGEHAQFGSRSGFETQFQVSRGEFGMNYMPDGIGDEVTLIVNIEGVRK